MIISLGKERGDGKFRGLKVNHGRRNEKGSLKYRLSLI